jgi:hypothetical protein
MKYVACLAGALLIAGSAVPAQAGTQTFGQFTQRDPNKRLFQYVKKDVGLNKKAEIHTTGTPTGNTTASIPIYYVFSMFTLPADLTGIQNAHLTVDFISNLGTTGSGSSRAQLFDTITNGSISIVRDTPAAEGTGTRTHLLTVSFTNAELDASQNDGSFTFKSNSNSVITYTSDFLSFNPLADKDFSFSFSGASPTFSSVLGSSSRSMRFSGTGTFAVQPVPEVSSWAMMVAGFGILGAALRRRSRSVSFA